MTIDSLIVFATILLVAAVIPGPGIISLISKTLGGGKLTGFYFLLGITLGDVVFVILAFFGMAALAHSMGDLFQWIKWIGAAFLAYMGYKILTSKTSMFEVKKSKTKKSPIVDIITGIFVTLGNPKPLIFYAAVMPQVIDLTQVSLGQLSIILLIVFATLTTVGLTYIWISNQIIKLAKDEKVQNRLNKGSGGVLMGTALWVALQG